MGQILFLRTGGDSGGGGGAQSLQAAYNGGRDVGLAFGGIQVDASTGEGLLNGDSALVVGANTTEKDLVLLTLAKVHASGDVPATNSPLVIGNLGSTAPAIQVYAVPSLSPSAPPDISDPTSDVTGLDVTFGGPDQGHHTEYSLRGVRWRKWLTESVDTPYAARVADLHLDYIDESVTPFDPATLNAQDRTALRLRVGSSPPTPVARFFSTTIAVTENDGPNAFEISHELNSLPVHVQVWRHFTAESDPVMIEEKNVELRILDHTRVQLQFAESPPAGSTYHVAIVGY